jgi:hypothetical protein
MKWSQNSKQIAAGFAIGFMVITGTYNAVVINSESGITGSEVKFAKRLDEVYGVVVSKREVAASLNWQKLSVQQASAYRANQIDRNLQTGDTSSSSNEVVQVSQAAVTEALNLNLTEVINPKKWQQGLNSSQFNGNLATNNGVIESLSVSLPNGEGISVSFSEMTGNVFEYDFEGELYSGMMYQNGENSYSVSLTNGPLEGTRLTFVGEVSVEQEQQIQQSQMTLAENTEANQGQEQSAEVVETDNEPVENQMSQPENFANQDMIAQEQGIMEQGEEQAQAFNFEQSQAM